MIAIFLFFITVSVQQKYTNQQAFQCFASKGISQCQGTFRQCQSIMQCQQQLKQYDSCSFDDSQQQKNHIFNGYCFRRWHQRAFNTRAVIDCLVGTCNLLYNSNIGPAQLYKCSQSIFLEKQIECGQACQQQIDHKIGNQFYQREIIDLYSQHFEDKQASNLAQLILHECIQQKGKGKEMIYNEQKLKQQQRIRTQSKDSEL